jgi:hypothetical protein
MQRNRIDKAIALVWYLLLTILVAGSFGQYWAHGEPVDLFGRTQTECPKVVRFMLGSFGLERMLFWPGWITTLSNSALVVLTILLRWSDQEVERLTNRCADIMAYAEEQHGIPVESWRRWWRS